MSKLDWNTWVELPHVNDVSNMNPLSRYITKIFLVAARKLLKHRVEIFP